MANSRCLTVWLGAWLCFGGCTPRGTETDRPPPTLDAASEPAPAATSGNAPPDLPACVTKMAAVAPAQRDSLSNCPSDPEGRPVMPEGRMRFAGTRAPELTVELAQNDEDRSHGLMFRPTLSEDQGMLFSWPEAAPRAFWMHNTCLALDLLFLDEKLRVVGVLEQVPPWNDARRQVRCPAQHVLEVRAGWAREFGVTPGAVAQVDARLPTR